MQHLFPLMKKKCTRWKSKIIQTLVYWYAMVKVWVIFDLPTYMSLFDIILLHGDVLLLSFNDFTSFLLNILSACKIYSILNHQALWLVHSWCPVLSLHGLPWFVHLPWSKHPPSGSILPCMILMSDQIVFCPFHLFFPLKSLRLTCRPFIDSGYMLHTLPTSGDVLLQFD